MTWTEGDSLPWRLEITRSIESDTIKSLHATNTSNAAHVGSGFHITFEYRNGARRNVYYRPRQIGYSDSVTTLQFEPYVPAFLSAIAVPADPPAL